MLPRLIFAHLLGAWLLLSFCPGELRAQNLDDVPVRLCGRDFMRALISICGKPRGKNIGKVQRPLPQVLDQEQEQEQEHVFVSGGNDVENGKLDPEVIPGWKEGQIPQLKGGSNWLKNMLSLHAHSEDSMTGSEDSKETVEEKEHDIKAINPSERYDFMLGTFAQRISDRPYYLAYQCCYFSCKRSDIARLC